MFPFAYDTAGNCFLLSLTQDDYDRVYFGDIEGTSVIRTQFSFQEFADEVERRLESRCNKERTEDNG